MNKPFTTSCIDQVVIPLLIISFFFLFVSFYFDPIPTTSDIPSKKILEFLKRMPTDWRFHAGIVVLFGLWASWRSHLHYELRKNRKSKYRAALRNGIKRRDWWAYHGLRERALTLRTGAGLTLGGVFTLLFGGIYFIVFILLVQVGIQDEATIFKIRQEIHIERFGEKLDNLAEGRYWLKTHDIGSGRPQSRVSLVTFSGASEFQKLPNPPGAIRTANARGNIGLVARRNGSAIMTIDGGQTWKPMKLELKSGEWITAAKLGDDEIRGLLVGNEGTVVSVRVQQNGEFTSKSKNSRLKENEKIRQAVFGKDAQNGLLVGTKGSVISVSVEQEGTPDLEKPRIQLENENRVRVSAFSEEGKHVLVVGSQGSALFVKVQGKGKLSSQKINLKINQNERITAAKLSKDGQFGLVIVNTGSIFVTANGWKDHCNYVLTLKEGDLNIRDSEFGVMGMRKERIIANLTKNAGKLVLLVGNKGSVFEVPTNKICKPKKMMGKKELELDNEEGIIFVALSNNGNFALLVSNKGSIFRVSLGSSNISSQSAQKPDLQLDLRTGDFISRRNVRKVNKLAPIVSNKGAVFQVSVTSSGKLSQKQMGLKLKERERISTFTISKDGKRGLVVGSKGSVFVTTDSGRNWNRSDIQVRRGNWITAAALSNDGQYGIVADNQSSIFVTRDGGQSWKETEWDEQIPALFSLVSVPLGEVAYLGVDRSGLTYLLKDHPDIAGWRTWKLLNIEDELAKNKLVLKSRIFQKTKAFLTDVGGSDKDKRTANSDKKRQGKKNSWFEIDNLTAMRIATMTVLFFLVQLLVRLYQYSMRLANFWDSRADAILLRQNFAENKAFSFDSLVQALAPDAYDFKPMPRSLFGWSLPRRN